MKRLIIALLTVVFLLVGCGEHQAVKIGGISDIGNVKIGVVLDTAHDDYVSEHYPEKQISRFNSLADALKALIGENIDVLCADAFALKLLTKQHKSLKILDDVFFSQNLGVGFNPENIELWEQFNDFLSEIKENGLYDEIYARWNDTAGNYQMPEFPNDGTDGILNLGTSTNVGIPFATFVNDKIAGLDIEIMYRFAEKINKKLAINNYDLEGMFESLNNGKSDVIAAGIVITPERSRQMLFSQIYFESASSLAILEKNLKE